jgi:hypothetical protein
MRHYITHSIGYPIEVGIKNTQRARKSRDNKTRQIIHSTT